MDLCGYLGEFLNVRIGVNRFSVIWYEYLYLRAMTLFELLWLYLNAGL
jgi:hypothetical protein